MAGNWAVKTKEAAGVGSGGWKEYASCGLRVDRVGALAVLAFCGYDGQAMLLRQGAARAHQRPRGVGLPPHLGHEFFQRYSTFALQQLNHAAGLAALAGPLLRYGLGRFLGPGGLVGCGSLRRRDVGRLWRKGVSDMVSTLSPMSSVAVAASLDPTVVSGSEG